MIFFDLEATGVNPQTDRITSIAIVRESEGYLPELWETLVNPGQPIPPEVQEITKITDEMVSHAPPFASIANEVARRLVAEPYAVGFGSAKLDLPILAEEFDRAGLPFQWDRFKLIDVLGLESVAQPRTLSAVYGKLFHRQLEGAHGALVDAVATRDVFREMVHRYPELRGKSLDELVLLSNHGKLRADPAGKLNYDDRGRLCYAFGKYRGIPVADEIGFARWMLYRDFAVSTKIVLEAELNRICEQTNAQDAEPPANGQTEIPF